MVTTARQSKHEAPNDLRQCIRPAPASAMRNQRNRPFFPARAMSGDPVVDRPRLRLISFKQFRKNSLVGFASIELPIGLRITDVPVLTSRGGKAWATLPSKPVLGADGKQVEVDGKRQYANLLEWRHRNLSDGFSRAVVEAVRAAHPGVFDGGGGRQ
jgi:hypothetical protein